MENLDEAYAEGWDAYERGEFIEDVPAHYDAYQRRQWQAGWEDAALAEEDWR